MLSRYQKTRTIRVGVSLGVWRNLIRSAQRARTCAVEMFPVNCGTASGASGGSRPNRFRPDPSLCRFVVMPVPPRRGMVRRTLPLAPQQPDDEPTFSTAVIVSMNAEDTGALQLRGTCPFCLTTVQMDGTFRRLRSLPQNSTLLVAVVQCAAHDCGRSILVDIIRRHITTLRKAEIVTMYPFTRRRFPEPEYAELVPDPIRVALDQTYSALCESAWLLVGIGCRVTLERMVNHFSAQGPNLYQKLEDLKQRFPALGAPLANADLVRLVGNAAAHHDFEMGAEEAQAALWFVEEVLRDTFILPDRQAKTIARLPARGGRSPSSL